jgi:hypothetical protein
VVAEVSEDLHGSASGSALDAVVDMARLLANASFDDVMSAAPALVLRALPRTTRVELRVTRPGRAHPVTSSADRHPGPTLAVAPVDSHVVSLRIALQDHPYAGALVLSTAAPDGVLGAAEVTADLVAIQVEGALDRAYCREALEDLKDAMSSYRDIGVAVGLVMARQGFDRRAALEVLHVRSVETERTLASIAVEVITEAATDIPPPVLTLVERRGPGAG